MRRRRWWRIALGILFLILALVAYAAWPGSSTFTVSSETTYITEPLDKDGYPDYVTALNQRLRGDITPETNANVLIWQALGPHPESGTMPPEYFQWLGYEPPERGDYWVAWEKYLRERLKEKFIEQREELTYRRDRVRQRPWATTDAPELLEWLKRNEKPLAVLSEATRRAKYYNPIAPRRTEDWSPGIVAAQLPTVQRCREVIVALASRAMLRLGEGRVEDAWQDLLACHRLARLLAHGCLIELLVGIASEQITCKADAAFLDYAKLTKKQILQCTHDLENLPPMAAVADSIDRFERFMTLDTMMNVARHGTPFLDGITGDSTQVGAINDGFWARSFTWSINWDPALRNANVSFDRCAAAMRTANRAEREQKMAAFLQYLTMMKQQVTDPSLVLKSSSGPTGRGERMGKIVVGLMFPAFQKVQMAADRHEQTQRNLHLAFALAAFRADHGQYPAKLDELPPKYIETIPDDLFAGKPLIYRLEGAGYLLYSVGPDGNDDGGRSYDDEPRGDDIAVRMPVPEPPRKK